MTTEQSVFTVARHRQTEGFALLELMISISVIAVLTVLSVSFCRISDTSFYTFPLQYMRLQSEAVLTGKRTYYTDESGMDYPPVYFHGSGTVNQARTIIFGKGGNIREIVIELGTGRLVFR